MNLNGLINLLVNFKIKFPNEIGISNAPVHFVIGQYEYNLIAVVLDQESDQDRVIIRLE